MKASAAWALKLLWCLELGVWSFLALACERPGGLKVMSLVLSVAHLEVGRLAEVFAPAFHPVHHPLNQLSGADPRRTKQLVGSPGVAQASRVQFSSAKVRPLSQQTAHRFRHFADAEQLRPGEVHDERRRGHLLKAKQRHGVAVA